MKVTEWAGMVTVPFFICTNDKWKRNNRPASGQSEPWAERIPPTDSRMHKMT